MCLIGRGPIVNRPPNSFDGAVWIVLDAASRRITEYSGQQWNDVYVDPPYAPGGGGGPSPAYFPVEDYVFPDSLTDVHDFNALGAYSHLELFWQARGVEPGATTVNLRLLFNADAGANYDWSWSYHFGGAYADQSAKATGQNQLIFALIPTDADTAGLAASGKLVIPNYRRTDFWKAVSGHSQLDDGTGNSPTTLAGGGTWKSTAAITAIRVQLSSNHFKQGSRFSLYGIQ